jgi:hypothetical protein
MRGPENTTRIFHALNQNQGFRLGEFSKEAWWGEDGSREKIATCRIKKDGGWYILNHAGKPKMEIPA